MLNQTQILTITIDLNEFTIHRVFHRVVRTFQFIFYI
jgi:hypothetical protein